MPHKFNIMETGLTYTSHTVVTDGNTAEHVGSGNLAVFATPAMAALMENAAMLAVAPALEEGQTTVGSEISISHIKPTGIGSKVSATAVLAAVEGRKLSFNVAAHDEEGMIGEGTHIRFIVDSERFMGKVR